MYNDFGTDAKELEIIKYINSIKYALQKNDPDALNVLLSKKDIFGNEMLYLAAFQRYFEYADLIDKALEGKNQEFLKKLINAKDKDGTDALWAIVINNTDKYIAFIERALEAKNQEFLMKLINIIDKDGIDVLMAISCYDFDKYIEFIEKALESENQEFLMKLINIKDKDGINALTAVAAYHVDKYIEFIEKALEAKNQEFLMNLINIRGHDGTDALFVVALRNIDKYMTLVEKTLKIDNKEFLKKIISAKVEPDNIGVLTVIASAHNKKYVNLFKLGLQFRSAILLSELSNSPERTSVASFTDSEINICVSLYKKPGCYKLPKIEDIKDACIGKAFIDQRRFISDINAKNFHLVLTCYHFATEKYNKEGKGNPPPVLPLMLYCLIRDSVEVKYLEPFNIGIKKR